MGKNINNPTSDDGVPTMDSVTPEMKRILCESATPEMRGFSVTPELRQYVAMQAQRNNDSSCQLMEPTIYSQPRNLK